MSEFQHFGKSSIKLEWIMGDYHYVSCAPSWNVIISCVLMFSFFELTIE